MLSLYGVAIEVRESEVVEQVCTNRDNCVDPMRAGNRIHKGSETGETCTMGFHVTRAGDEQFVTAGHCSYQGSNNWYHQGMPGDGFVGAKTATQYQQAGIDIMRVQMADAQASDMIIGTTYNVSIARDPVQGEAVCASRGKSASVDCGWVSDASQQWTGEACGCLINGANHDGIVTVLGDSGSPIYINVAPDDAIAIGIHNALSGEFARVDDALDLWGWNVVT